MDQRWTSSAWRVHYKTWFWCFQFQAQSLNSDLASTETLACSLESAYYITLHLWHLADALFQKWITTGNSEVSLNLQYISKDCSMLHSSNTQLDSCKYVYTMETSGSKGKVASDPSLTVLKSRSGGLASQRHFCITSSLLHWTVVELRTFQRWDGKPELYFVPALHWAEPQRDSGNTFMADFKM